MTKQDDLILEAAKHALEVYYAGVLMLEEMKWRRTHDSRSREQMIRDGIRKGTDILVEQALQRRDNPLAHDFNPE
jgi:hypothetical protein